MTRKNSRIPVGGNPYHVKYVQEARRSNETGAHGLGKKATSKKNRRTIKESLRKEEQY